MKNREQVKQTLSLECKDLRNSLFSCTFTYILMSQIWNFIKEVLSLTYKNSQDKVFSWIIDHSSYLND